MPIIGAIGFFVTAHIFQGSADGMSLLGAYMLPAEVFWIATVIGTVVSVISLMRHEPVKVLAWCGLIINGGFSIYLGMGIIYSILTR